MPRPPAELELQTNFYAISKNVKFLKIGPVEQKLWKFRQNVRVKNWKAAFRLVGERGMKIEAATAD